MPIDTFILKITIMPLVILLVTWISRRWGNMVGGMIAGMPWVGGAILLFIALEQGKLFALDMLPGATVGLIAWLSFCMSYVWIGQRRSPLITLIASNIICLGLAYIFRILTPYLSQEIWIVVLYISLLVSLVLFPKITQTQERENTPIKSEIGLRIAMITIFVVSLTYFANVLGPSWSGVLTPFPVITSTLAFFTHLGQGIKQTKVILLGMYTGVVGFGGFLLTLKYILPDYSLGLSFVIALLINVILVLIAKWLFSRWKLLTTEPSV